MDQGSWQFGIPRPADLKKGLKSNGGYRPCFLRSLLKCGDRAFALPSNLFTPTDVRFSNRPFEVKRFQTIHHSSVDVACGLVLLFGLGAKALPVWDSKTRWNNLSVGLAVRPTAGSSGHTNSPHPSSREGHHSTVRWSSRVLLLG